MERKVYTDVIFRKLKNLDFRWFLHKAYIFIFLKIESFLKTGFAPAPLTCGVVVTENCNLRCPMCILPLRYMENPKMEETQKWKMVMDQLNELKIGGIALSGGEPTIRKDIFELVNHASNNNQTTITLNSNAASLSESKIKELVSSNINNINISIDSGDEAINDHLRGGKNVLNRVLKGIRAISEERKRQNKNFSITVVSTLSDLNLDSLELLFQKVASSEADRLCFIPLHDIKDGITYMPKQEKVSPNLYDQLVALSQKYNIHLENSSSYLKGFYNVMSGGVMKENCNNGYTQMIIGDDLKIYRCVPYMNTGRHLFQWNPEKESLKDLWNSPTWREDRKKALTCKECFWDCHAELNFLVKM